MRVIIISQEDLAKQCGHNRRLDFIARALSDAGAEVFAVGPSSGGPPTINGTNIAALRKPPPPRFLWVILRSLVEIVRRRASAVLITSIGAPYNGTLAALIKTVLRRRVVYDCQDPVIEILSELYGHGALLRLTMPLVLRQQRILDRAVTTTLIVGKSQEALMRSNGWIGTLLHVFNVHGGIAAGDAGRSAFRQQYGWESSKVVIYAGGLQRWRGLDLQIDGIARARAKGADVRLLILGFNEQQDLQQRCAALGLAQEAVVIAQAVPADELYDILADCDYAISSEALTYGMQSKIFDYLVNGVRVISIDDGRDINHYFGDFFRYFDGTAEGLAQSLIETPPRMAGEEQSAAAERLRHLWDLSRANAAQAFGIDPTAHS